MNDIEELQNYLEVDMKIFLEALLNAQKVGPKKYQSRADIAAERGPYKVFSLWSKEVHYPHKLLPQDGYFEDFKLFTKEESK